MEDQPEPPRKIYGFKPKEFERANPARPDEAPPDAPTPDPGITLADSGRIDVNDLIRAGAGDGPQLGNNAVVNRDNEIHEVLRHNHARANAAGLNELTPLPERKSRRKRDYFLLVGGMDGFFVLMMLIARNPLMTVFGVAGIIVTTVGLTWVMWFVMDDY